MNESLNICLECGICCEGTLIGFVELDPQEVPAIRELMDIEETNDKGFFLQPCDKLGCDGCTIYSQRPKQCAAFKCKLLESVEQKEMDFDTAVAVVDLVKQQQLAIENRLEKIQLELQSQSFYFKMLELKSLFRKTKPHSPLMVHLEELMPAIKKLDTLLLHKFGVHSVDSH